jgi:class 3 adenylate cyclase
VGETAEIKYASEAGLHIAYSLGGQGPQNVLMVPNWLTDVESMLDVPALGQQYADLCRYASVVLFDQPGTGHSDPIMGAMPSLETFAELVGVVMDAERIDRTILAAWDLATPAALMFAAGHPDRVSGLVTVGGTARWLADEGYPGIPLDEIEEVVAGLVAIWGKPDYARAIAPSMSADVQACEEVARWLRHALSPGTARRVFDMALRFDVRSLLPLITCPVLILQSKDPSLGAPLVQAEYLAAHISAARLEVFDTSDHLPYQRQHREWMTGLTEEFITGRPPAPAIEDRVLATVLFTDFVSSTETAARLGDHRWRRTLDAIETATAAEIHRYKGRLIKSTGDGVLATFDGPARAIRCALALAYVAGRQGVEIRAGVHTGEVELRGKDIGGIAVHIASRVMSLAGAGELLASSTVKDLVVGSGIEFADRGTHELKGVPGEWPIYSIRS